MSTDTIIQIVSLLFTAGAVYGAIRADIRGIHEAVKRAQSSADDAHRRLDDVLMYNGNRTK